MNLNQGYALIFAFLLLLITAWVLRFLYLSAREKAYTTPSWRDAIKEGMFSRRLRELEKSYPDKVRLQNFWILTQRLKREQIPGEFAELGVYKGESAALLHAMDPDRDLYLFDTFSGFLKEDLSVESGKAADYTARSFSDTNLREVLQYIDGGTRIKAYPGRFPDSVPEPGTKFSLVNIDVDLYNPTTAGLNYFFPRLSEGGVIMVHDYSPDWPGVVRAVDEFLANEQAWAYLLPDQYGTMVIIKPGK